MKDAFDVEIALGDKVIYTPHTGRYATARIQTVVRGFTAQKVRLHGEWQYVEYDKVYNGKKTSWGSDDYDLVPRKLDKPKECLILAEPHMIIVVLDKDDKLKYKHKDNKPTKG